MDEEPKRFYIHEASESYLLAQGIPYQTAHGLYYSAPDRHGVFSYYPIDPRNAITREDIIRDQLNLQGPPAGFYRQEPFTDVRRQQ